MAGICDFNEVRVSIPKAKIRKQIAGSSFLSDEDAKFFKEKSAEIEAALNKLAHARSIVEKIRLRER